jgi:hypothetical protein
MSRRQRKKRRARMSLIGIVIVEFCQDDTYIIERLSSFKNPDVHGRNTLT